MAAEAQAKRLDGVSYPVVKRKTLPHHAWLSNGMLTGNFDELDSALTSVSGGRLLLSDENIYTEAQFADPDAVAALREKLAGRPLRLIACKRDVESWKVSFYKQALRNRGRGKSIGSGAFWGRAESFDDFFALPEMHALTQQDAMLQRISDLFDTPVQQLEMTPERDILAKFLDAIGMPHPEQTDARRANPSMSDIDTELMRQANAQGMQAHGLMRLLIEQPADRPAPEIAALLRRGKRNLVQNSAAAFDWTSILHAPNAPLHYDHDAFDARRDELRALANALVGALTTNEAG